VARGHDVVHIVFGDTVDHVRDHYDTVHQHQALTHHGLGVRARVERERHRWLLAYPAPAPGRVARGLSFLKSTMGCCPRLLILEGLEASQIADHGEEIHELAQSLKCLVWIGMTSGERALEGLPAGSPTLSIAQHGSTLALTLGSTEGKPLNPVTLDASTFLPARQPGTNMDGQHEPEDRTLFSGGARGSEAAFGKAAHLHGIREVHYTFDGHQQERREGTRRLSPRELAAGDVSLVHASRKLNRTYSSDPENIRKVLQMLWHMVSRSQQVFVVGAIQQDQTVRGGTGWAVELARTWGKELWVFDQPKSAWFHWTQTGWVPGQPEIRSRNFCGSGTRQLDAGGQSAIDALFERSFGSAGFED